MQETSSVTVTSKKAIDTVKLIHANRSSPSFGATQMASINDIKSNKPCVTIAGKSTGKPGSDNKSLFITATPVKVAHITCSGVDTAPRQTLVKVSEPPPRAAGVKVESVAELVDKLKNEAQVI